MTTPDIQMPTVTSWVGPLRSSPGDTIFNGRTTKFVPLPRGVSTIAVNSESAGQVVVNMSHAQGGVQVTLGTFAGRRVLNAASESNGAVLWVYQLSSDTNLEKRISLQIVTTPLAS